MIMVGPALLKPFVSLYLLEPSGFYLRSATTSSDHVFAVLARDILGMPAWRGYSRNGGQFYCPARLVALSLQAM